jgi:hypothetical protein
MKRIIQSRTTEHLIDLYTKIGDVKKEVSIIKNNHLKHISCSIYKIEKKVDKIYGYMITGMGALILTLIVIAFRSFK